MRQAGTILPNKESLHTNDRHCREKNRKAEEIANRLLKHCAMKKVQGENRYYESEDKYAIVSTRDLKIRWFKVMADGDYPIR